MPGIWNRPLTRWVVLLAIWPILAVAVATQEYVYRKGFNVPVDWLDALRYPAVEYLFWILLAPPIWDAALRFRLARRDWPRSAAALLACGLAVDLLHGVYRGFLHELVYPKHLAPPAFIQPPRGQLIEFYAIGNLFGDLWLYATIVAVAHMVHYYRRFESRERELSAARLQALEAQLQPHFLFNTLNSIATLMHEDVEAADEMITKLATLLRRTLHNSAAFEIPLREEMEILGIYLDIQRTRFQDRLDTEICVDPSVMNALVPRLILQPLVENAVRHGVSSVVGAGRIEVRGWKEGKWLRLAVGDDGPGMNHAAPTGLGLANTRARLSQHYEEHYRFEVKNGDNGGVVAEIDVLYLEADSHGNQRPDRG